ncbi:hypothetical protein EJB05_56616, partial [Eragrostis curvula]
MGLESFSWVVLILALIESLLPFCAFAVTADWDRSFECFGAVALLTDVGISTLRSLTYVWMTGLVAAECPSVTGPVLTFSICAAISAAAFVFLLTFSCTAEAIGVVRVWCGFFLVIFVAGMGYLLHTVEKPIKQSDVILDLMMYAIVGGLVIQAGNPLVKRFTMRGQSSLIKGLATIIKITCYTFDALYFLEHFRSSETVTKSALTTHTVMCVTGTVCGVFQLATRLLGSKSRINARMSKFCHAIVSLWELLYDIGTFLGACIAACYSCCCSPVESVKECAKLHAQAIVVANVKSTVPLVLDLTSSSSYTHCRNTESSSSIEGEFQQRLNGHTVTINIASPNDPFVAAPPKLNGNHQRYARYIN